MQLNFSSRIHPVNGREWTQYSALTASFSLEYVFIYEFWLLVNAFRHHWIQFGTHRKHQLSINSITQMELNVRFSSRVSDVMISRGVQLSWDALRNLLILMTPGSQREILGIGFHSHPRSTWRHQIMFPFQLKKSITISQYVQMAYNGTVFGECLTPLMGRRTKWWWWRW